MTSTASPSAADDPLSPRLVELFARLVAEDTVSRNSNLPLARLLADYLDRPGVQVTLLPGPASDDGGAPAKANLLVRLGPEVDPETRAGLVLSGHMDVVPADEDGWGSDPFTLTDRGDRWVARGSADMKGFLALASHLASELDPGTLEAPLVLLWTYDEELGCLGAGHLVRTWDQVIGRPPGEVLPRAAVIGEPTSLAVVRSHKGHLKARATFDGVSAHSGYPHLGDNAIERAARAVVALGELREALEAERWPSSASFPEVPYPALNVGTIEGGSAINVVPDRCQVEVGVRLLPGMEADPLVERLRGAVTPWAGPRGCRFEVLSASPPLEVDGGVPAHRQLARLAGELAGTSGDQAVSFATDAGWLQHLGLDCVICGPGAIQVAHKPDEWIPKDQVRTASRLLSRAIDHFCRPSTRETGP